MDRTTQSRYQLYPSVTPPQASDAHSNPSRAPNLQSGRAHPSNIRYENTSSGTMGFSRRNEDDEKTYQRAEGGGHHRKSSSFGLLENRAQEADNDRRLRKKASRIFKNRGSQSKQPLRFSQKRRRAGITVDTTYNRHKGSHPKEVRRNNGSVDRSNGLGIIALNESMTNKSPDGLMIGGLDAFGTPLSATQDNGLSPLYNPTLDVSPSDRPITVGLSVAPEVWSEIQSDSGSRQRSNSNSSPYTPTIIITPAQQASQLHSNVTSMYSHPPSYYQTTLGPNQFAPPVPEVPYSYRTQVTNNSGVTTATQGQHRANIDAATSDRSRSKQVRDSAMTDFEEDDDGPRKQRVMSSATLFEEDNTPKTATSFGADLTREASYGATIPTPRRSQGWWNYITTPFEMSQNSQWPRFSPTEDKTPELPKMPAFASSGPKLGVDIALPAATADTPMKSYFSASTVTSMASPWSRLGSQRSPISPDAQDRSPMSGGAELSIAQQLASMSREPKRAPSPGLSPVELQKPRGLLHPSGNKQGTERDTVWSTMLASNSDLSRSETNKTSQTALTASPDMEVSPVLAVAKQGTVIAPKAIEKGNSPVNSVHPTVMLAETPQLHHAYSPLDKGTFSKKTPPVPISYSPRPSTASSRPYTPDRTRNNVVPFFEAPPKFEEKQKKQKQRSMAFSCCGKREGKEVGKKKRKKRFWIMCGICWLILLAIILIVSLVLTLGRKSTVDTTPVQNQWLNLTGYPPIPTGISTVAQPEIVETQAGCVSPATVWSCALPKEEQESVKPNEPDQPNFRFVIRYKNDSVPTKVRRDHSRSLQKRQGLADLFVPMPPPPSIEDQDFLSNVTDGNTDGGEDTPFYISLMSSASASKAARDVKRQSGSPSLTAQFPNLATIIPPPATVPGGVAAPAALFPLPTAQPLRIYNRGEATEHYGFYTYYDRSIFFKDITGTNSSFGGNPADIDGGSTRDAAAMRCTWAQTRFLVQIWTNSQATKPLLSPPASATSSASASQATATENSATNFLRPGSFPYPVTITMDRHGGDITQKMIYCYDLDSQARPVKTNPQFMLEDRSFGGTIVNEAKGPFASVKIALADGGPGGIDGGTGGCKCKWQNFQDTQ